jgi:GTPase SAR1 family protein
MTPEERERLRKKLMAFAYQCSSELREIIGELPALRGLIELVQRLDGSTVPRIAFAGRFSAGKTTLVNAILGEKVLPEGMAETTAIPTRVRYGNTMRLFLKSSYGEYYEASDAERQEFMNLTASNLRSELLKRYVQQQDEAVLEHPNVSKEVEVIDLPGVSSSHQKIEDRALMSLRFANGVVWVANAKQGGLTKADIEYLKTNVPAETPKLIALTHLDLMPPSQHSSVLSNAQSLAQTIPNVVGVVGTTKTQSLGTNQEWWRNWYRLLSRSENNKRLKPLVQEVVGILGKLRAPLKEGIEKEVEKQVKELLCAAGLSEEHLRDYLKELLDLCERGFPKIAAVAKADWKAGVEMMGELERRLVEKCDQTFDSLCSRAAEAAVRSRWTALCSPAYVLVCSIYRMTAKALRTYLTFTLIWAVREAIEHGESRLREGAWSWHVIHDGFVAPSWAVLRTVGGAIIQASLESLMIRKISDLEFEGQGLLESGQLDELG